MTVAISVKDIGVSFRRNRKRNFSIREMLLQQKNTSPKGDFWALRNINDTTIYEDKQFAIDILKEKGEW